MYNAIKDHSDRNGIMARTELRTGGPDRERFPVAGSTFMSAEEIDRERERSGWNPYADEEEAADLPQPVERQMEDERGLRRLQSMYPEAAKLMLPFVEEECDKMEYEGSPMFDEYPDRTTVYRIEERVFAQVKDRFPEEGTPEPDDMLSMQCQGPCMGVPGRSMARDLARVLLLNEMHHRRRRRAAIRRGQF